VPDGDHATDAVRQRDVRSGLGQDHLGDGSMTGEGAKAPHRTAAGL
jgi:hypothetical protein